MNPAQQLQYVHTVGVYLQPPKGRSRSWRGDARPKKNRSDTCSRTRSRGIPEHVPRHRPSPNVPPSSSQPSSTDIPVRPKPTPSPKSPLRWDKFPDTSGLRGYVERERASGSPRTAAGLYLRPPLAAPACISPVWGGRRQDSTERASAPPTSRSSARSPRHRAAAGSQRFRPSPRTCPTPLPVHWLPDGASPRLAPIRRALHVQVLPALPPTASQSGASLAVAVPALRGGANDRGRLAPRSGGRRAGGLASAGV